MTDGDAPDDQNDISKILEKARELMDENLPPLHGYVPKEFFVPSEHYTFKSFPFTVPITISSNCLDRWNDLPKQSFMKRLINRLRRIMR